MTPKDEDVFPDRDMSARDKIEFMLEQEGWAMEAVRAQADIDPPMPTYSYTVGLTDRFGFAEVCIFGLKPVACRGLFGMVVDALAGGTEFPVGAAFIGLLDSGQACAFLPVDAPTAVSMFPALAEHHTLQGEAPESFELVQMTWPDPAGNLPWEPGFDPKLGAAQLLLGEPPTA